MSLADQVLVTALGYARSRFAELSGPLLDDASAFAQALGVNGFADGAGTVASNLTAAKADLQAAGAAVDGGNVATAAGGLGSFVTHLRAAAAIVGRPLEPLLTNEIDWAAVAPSGLAAQLGLPAAVPGLVPESDALTYTLPVPGHSLAPAPLTLGYDSGQLKARLRTDGGAPALSISLALNGIEAGVGGGDISTLLGGAAGSVQSDVLLGVDTTHGLTLSGGASPRVVLPAAPKVGALDIRELTLELPATPDTYDLGATFTVDLGGVITGTVEGAGLHVHIDPDAVAAGNNPLSVAVKGPSGIGLALDAGIVRGGGFLDERPGGYGGALELRLGPIAVKAVGLLTLRPGFALVVVMSIEFTPAIDLSFGFTLNAVGGILGIEHRMDTDALRAGIADGAIDHLLFPEDPVAAAPTILTTLEKVFPFEQGGIVIGPMVELGWGRPVSFLRAQLGVILSLPDPKIVILGRIIIAIPAPELPIVDLRATLYGEITPDHLLILVSLRGSRIAGFSVTGDIGMLLKWSGGAEFAISAGGFHPRFQPPKELTGMQRLGMDLSPPAILTLRAEAYFALTSNSVQLGARVDMGADLDVASITGHFQFDALVLFAPHFMFMIDLGIGLTVRAFGTTLCGVTINLHLEGPAPWRAHGNAEVDILWWTVSIDVGPYTWGDEDNPPPAPADPRQLVWAALDHNPGSWQALAPPEADEVVHLLPASPSDTEVTVHPLGLFDVRQHAVPLETVITRVGANPVPEGQRRVFLGLPTANHTPAGAVSKVTDLFSAGNFLDLTDDQKLSRPSFEQMPAGARLRPPGESAEHAASRQVELRYETFVADDDSLLRLRSVATLDTFFGFTAATTLAAGAAGRSALRARTRYGTAPDPIVLADPGETVVRSKATLATEAAGQVMTYTQAAEIPLGGDLQLTRLGVG
jgi:hypothetical protein